jgi:hypothetical protein
MPLRIGFDMDGVLADFARAYHDVETRIYGPAADVSRPVDPEEEEASSPEAVAVPEEPKPAQAPPFRRRREVVWQTIKSTPDFWTTLQPIEPGAVRRIHDLAMRHRWEVFFITQRPDTDGETVQRQTQRWLVQEGYDLPSVLVIPGARGAAAAALSLDFHVDDNPRNCIDVKAQSGARPLLIVASNDDAVMGNARRLGIGTAPAIGAALDILDEATRTLTQPTLLHRLAQLVGWH